MEGLKIQTRPLWTALHLMPPYEACTRLGSGQVAESLCTRGLSLPCSTNLTEKELETVVAGVATVLGRPVEAL